LAELKHMIFEMIKEKLDEAKDFTAINLAPITKGMKKYSHGQNHTGYVDKDFKTGASHKKMHDALTKSGYNYFKKTDGKIGDMDITYHMYSKSAGPYADHNLTITTQKGNGKVWNVEHKTVKDNS